MRLFFPMCWGQPCLWPSHNIFLHLHLSQASSLQSPFFLISYLSTSLHLFLGLPFTPLSSTCSVLILFIQHNSSLLSTWPNHLNLFHCMTSATSSIASMLLTHSILFLSLKLTPVIHLNILISLLCIFLISSIFVGHVSLPTTLQVLCMLYNGYICMLLHGDMLSQEGGCEHAILKRIQTGWLKFRELSGLLIGKGMNLKSKWIIYTTCIRPAMAHSTTFLGTLSKTFSRSTNTHQSSLCFPLYLSCNCLAINIAWVVPVPGLNPNCILSISTVCLNLLSRTLSATFLLNKIISNTWFYTKVDY